MPESLAHEPVLDNPFYIPERVGHFVTVSYIDPFTMTLEEREKVIADPNARALIDFFNDKQARQTADFQTATQFMLDNLLSWLITRPQIPHPQREISILKTRYGFVTGDLITLEATGRQFGITHNAVGLKIKRLQAILRHDAADPLLAFIRNL